MQYSASRSSAETYFIKLSVELFKDRLLWISNTDAYLRQPCYSSRAKDHFYLILEATNADDIPRIKYLHGEFPEYFINYLTENELNLYPGYCKWQFIFSHLLYGKNTNHITLPHTSDDHLRALAQAIISVGHIARLYYLSDLNEKSHTWAVRQLGWAFRYTEKCIIKVWHYLNSGQYSLSGENFELRQQVNWLSEINNDWYKFEKCFLTDINSYKDAALGLNNIVQYYAGLLSASFSSINYTHYGVNEFNELGIDVVSEFREAMIGEFSGNLRCLYLSGSTARGDKHKYSDIDTIGVFNELNEEALRRIKKIVSTFNNLSIYTLSINDLAIYPSYKYYTLNEGTKKIYGDISFLSPNIKEDFNESIINNIFILIQIARANLVIGNYGPRSHYILKLMFKLADHGCLRLIAKQATKHYIFNKEQVRKFFKKNQLASELFDFLININEHEHSIKLSLLHGDSSKITHYYRLLNNLSENLLFNMHNIDNVINP